MEDLSRITLERDCALQRWELNIDSYQFLLSDNDLIIFIQQLNTRYAWFLKENG